MFDHLYCVFSEAGFTIFGKWRRIGQNVTVQTSVGV